LLDAEGLPALPARHLSQRVPVTKMTGPPHALQIKSLCDWPRPSPQCVDPLASASAATDSRSCTLLVLGLPLIFCPLASSCRPCQSPSVSARPSQPPASASLSQPLRISFRISLSVSFALSRLRISLYVSATPQQPSASASLSQSQSR